jgi:glycosyltransferase involved in cell wall biosynthesis
LDKKTERTITLSLKILFILPEFYPVHGGGIITFYQNLLLALRPHCERIKVIVGSGYTQDNYNTVWNDIEVEYLQPERYQRHLKTFSRFDFIPSFKSSLAAAWAIYEQANAGEGFDIVECNDFGLGYLPWVLKQAAPVVVRLHGSAGQIAYHDPIPDENLAGDFFRQAELLTLPLAHHIQTHSKANQAFWVQNLQKKTELLFPVFSPGPDREPVPLPQRFNYGLVTGRLQYWKGPVTLAKALRQDNSGLSVRWYGRDMHYNESNSLMSHYLAGNFNQVWQKSFIYQQKAGPDQIASLQHRAKYGLVPSGWDMYNMSCIEFMAAGTPVICSDGAGSNDLIEGGVNGYKFEAGDENGLLQQMQLISTLKTDAYSRVSDNAYQTVRNLLSAAVLIPQYMAAYKQVITTFSPLKVSDYLISTYQPDRQDQQIGDLLNQQPLSRLLPYIKNRLLKKAGIK